MSETCKRMSDVGPSQEGENYEEDIFKVSPSYGGNPLPIPEEGEIGWGSTPTFEPWEDTGWEADASQRLRISNNYKTATAMLEMTCVAVMGERTFSTGLHAWTVIIEVSGAAPSPPSPASPASPPAPTSASSTFAACTSSTVCTRSASSATPHLTPPEASPHLAAPPSHWKPTLPLAPQPSTPPHPTPPHPK